jgi:cysteine synthase/rhodanese-related sulfurtransferase
MNPKRVHLGANGLKDYLSPARDEYAPLVELPSALNQYLDSHDIHISLKLMNTLPLGNVKSLPAYNLLNSTGVAGKNIVESSSGNTVFSMGLLAPLFGANSVHAIASGDISDGKLKLLQLANVNIELRDGPICPDASDPTSTIAVARAQGMRDGWVNPGQYDNDANPQAHQEITGPQLYDQLGETLGMVVAGLGTTGTLVGTSRYLKTQLPAIKIGGAVRVPNNKVPGVRTQHGLTEVAFAWQDLLTEEPVMISEHEAYETSLEMIRSGLLVGPSSGFAIAAARSLVGALLRDGLADELRGKHVVAICPDSCFPYVDEYFEVLDEDYFPEIKDLSSGRWREASSLLANIPEITADELSQDMVNGVSQHYTVIDVRDVREFEDHHIPGSIHVPLIDVKEWLGELNEEERQRKYLFVCSRMQRSARAARSARDYGVLAYILGGGTAAWSEAGFERTRPMLCEVKHP